MKKIELVYRQLLFSRLEKKTGVMTQAALARDLHLSLSTVNLALEPLRRMNAIGVLQRGLVVKDVKKVLYYWASLRNIDKDIIYQTRSDGSVKKIESEIPSRAIFAAFSAYKFTYKDVPADYSEVYVYADGNEIRRRFPPRAGPSNIIVLKKDEAMGRYGNKVTQAQLFVDLWNLKQWYAKEYLLALERRIDGILA
jgi:predicted transcriptional regulator